MGLFFWWDLESRILRGLFSYLESTWSNQREGQLSYHAISGIWGNITGWSSQILDVTFIARLRGNPRWWTWMWHDLLDCLQTSRAVAGPGRGWRSAQLKEKTWRWWKSKRCLQFLGNSLKLCVPRDHFTLILPRELSPHIEVIHSCVAQHTTLKIISEESKQC